MVAFVPPAAAILAMYGVERIWPKGPQVSGRKQLAVLRFWAFYIAASTVITTAFNIAKQHFHLEPLLTLPLQWHVLRSPMPWTIYIVGPLATLVFYDFFSYWMHRAQHRWFWKQHSVHHSIVDISAVNSYLHWTEELLRVIFIFAPTTLVLGIDAGGVTVASILILTAQSSFIHTTSAVNFGRFGRWFLADNLWHRVHHSIDPAHFGRNFATAFPLWDVIFGTARFPARGEWPRTGLPDRAAPETLKDYVLRPFLRDASQQRADRGAVGIT